MKIKKELNYSYIAIEGNIGAGKTTLSEMLGNEFDYRLILEQFTENPFLPLFYENPERYTLQVELYFMTQRHQQLQAFYKNQNTPQQKTIADYFFLKTLLFADSNLTGAEKHLFQQLFHTLNANFPSPDILIYLHRPVPELKTFIKQRGREMEDTIDPIYLDKVEKAYFGFFKTQPDFPVLVIDMKGVDFVKTPCAYEKIVGLLQEEYADKVYYLKL